MPFSQTTVMLMDTVTQSPGLSLAGVASSQTLVSSMITIGIVEDNRDLRSSLKRMVDAAPGYRCVCVCDSAEDALREMPVAKPQVVLMDIHLPNRSGIECTRRLRDLCPATQVLILTVYEDYDSILNALKAGHRSEGRWFTHEHANCA